MPLLVLLLFLCLALDAGAAQRREVFVLHSYSQDYPWTKRQHEGFVAELSRQAESGFSVRIEYMDTKRIPYDPVYGTLMADHLAAKYRGYVPDMIYVSDDNALTFALDHLSRIFPSAPVVFSGVNDYGVKSRLDPARVTGVFERKEIAPNLELVRGIAPDVSEIVVVGDASETYRAIERELREELKRYPGIRARFVADKRLDRLLDGLRDGQEHFLFLTTLGAVSDARGEPLGLSETIAAIVALERHTVISMEDVYLLPGVLGGYVTSGVHQGEAAARLVGSYLAGSPMIELPPLEHSPNKYLLDARELQRAGLQLPPEIAAGATILNPLPGFYQQYERLIVGSLYTLAAMFALLLSASLIVVIRKNRQIGSTAHALRESEQKLRTVIEGLPVVLWMIDRDGRFLLSEGKGLALMGLEPGQVIGQSLFDLYRDVPEVVDDTRRVLAGDTFVCTRWLAGVAFELRYSPLRGADGTVTGAIGVAIDVTERKQSEERLAFLANYDPVTGLPNRFLLGDRLEHAIRHADRTRTRVALLFVDLDNFKAINDTLGHAAGDALLKQVAVRLGAVVRETDTVSRLGGDEFTVILQDLAHEEEAVRAAAKILEQSARPYGIGASEVYVTPSIGIAIYPEDGGTVEALLMNADAAMYRAKENGRNGFQFFTKEINARAQERLELGNQLRGALARGEFSLNYQPKVAIADGAVIGFEALLRWRSDRLGPVSPAVFVPVLEENGLIVEVGEWVLREACRWAAGIPGTGAAAPGISVNLSARQFRQPRLDRVVEDALGASGLPAARLELEITESSLVDLEANLQTMARLRQLGVGLSIDDFGTGYSSLSYLKRFPVDRLKVDASFVRDVAVDPDDAAIVTAIVGLAHHLGLRVIAEGVETLDQLKFLRRQQCDEIQGYFVARPMPADEALAWLLAHRSEQAFAALPALVANGG